MPPTCTKSKEYELEMTFKNIWTLLVRKLLLVSGCVIAIIKLLYLCHSSHSFSYFECANRKGNAPTLPKAYSANIRINFVNQQYTVEMIYATNGREGKELIEFKRQDRHVKYITRGDQKSVLFIQYKEDEHPTCSVTKSVNMKDFLKREDAGESNIILKAAEVMMYPSMFNIYPTGPNADTGVLALRYEGCLSEPNINISISFAAKDWKMTHISSLVKDVNYPETVTAEIGNVMITALYSYFDPSEPDDSLFQPPEDVFCDGFRVDKVPPAMSNYFSYNAEIIVYESAVGIAPIVSNRKVYYDYNAGISRIDFNDPLATESDLFSKVIAQKKSIIHDFNAGVQYIFDPVSGKCSIDFFQETFNAITFEETKDSRMLKGTEFFWLDDARTSYNGRFPFRGFMADVYTALRVNPQTKARYIISWYFSTEETRVVENENVLLCMYVRPETDFDKEGVTEINFFNFVSEEPNVFTYDLTSCYNDSSSKTLVFTFPAVDALRGSEKLIGMKTHLAIKDITGVRKQRIYLKEVIFSGKYMYAEFSLLEESPIKGKVSDKEVSLDHALKKLQESVSRGNFTVKVESGKSIIFLKPEPDGLNVFAGDRVRRPTTIGYQEGSVISLTVGMLCLGFLLGGMTINLIINRKFGVSLFQKSLYGKKGFQNPLNESSM